MPPPTHSALHYCIDPITFLLKSITVAPLMNAPNIAVNRTDDPRPCHVSGNGVNELTEKKSTFSGRKDTTLFRVEGGIEAGFNPLSFNRKGRAAEVAPFTRSEVGVYSCVRSGWRSYIDRHAHTRQVLCVGPTVW